MSVHVSVCARGCDGGGSWGEDSRGQFRSARAARGAVRGCWSPPGSPGPGPSGLGPSVLSVPGAGLPLRSLRSELQSERDTPSPFQPQLFPQGRRRGPAGSQGQAAGQSLECAWMGAPPPRPPASPAPPPATRAASGPQTGDAGGRGRRAPRARCLGSTEAVRRLGAAGIGCGTGSSPRC